MALRVLLVDDEEDILQSTSIWLHAAGYETEFSRNGEEAIAVASAIQPDAIIMDIRMPRKDGLTALHELQRNVNTRNIPVVILSASLVDKEKALDAGATYYVTKPYHGHALIRTVEAAIACSSSNGVNYHLTTSQHLT